MCEIEIAQTMPMIKTGSIIILYLLILLLPLSIIAQHQEIDSLFEIWLDSTLTSQQRLEAFHKCLKIDAYLPFPKESPLDKWYNEIDKAITLAENTGNDHFTPMFLEFALFYQSVILWDYELSDITAIKAMDKALQFEDYSSFFHTSHHFILGFYSKKNNKYNETSLLKILDSIKNHITSDIELFDFNVLMGSYYIRKSRTVEAITAFRKAVELSDKLDKNNSHLSYALENMGIIHNEIENYDEAEIYYNRALSLSKIQKDIFRIGSIYFQLTILNLRIDKPNKSLYYTDSVIQTFKPLIEENTAGEFCIFQTDIAYISKAGVLNLQKKYREALTQLQKLEYNYNNLPQVNKSFADIYYYNQLASSYFGLNNYSKAIASANKVLKFSKGQYLIETRNSAKILYQSWEKLGNTANALESYKNFVRVKDSIAVQRNSQEVTRFEIESAFQQERYADSLNVAKTVLTKELEFQHKLKRQRKSKNIFIALGIAILFIAIGLLYRLYFIRKTQIILEEKNRLIEAEKEKAKSSEKAKHQFLANMSHEIRTPMNAIKGMIDILIRRKPKANQIKYLNGVKESSDSLLVIINDILDLSKIEVGKIDLEHIPFSILEVIKNVHTIMQFRAEEKSLDLKLDIPENIPQVLGDPSRLRQVIINLVGNAIKFTEKGVVTTSLKIKTQNDSKINLHFTISDTGIGIDEDKLKQVFNSFEQAYTDTNRKFGGTGLGLSISKKLIDIHKGKIWAESKKGKGSQFHFTIPYQIAQEQEKTEVASTTTSIDNISDQLKGIKVLLVEDNAFNAIVAQEELEDAIEDVTIVVAENGVIALEQVNHTNFDIILMDVQMPVMNGYEATKAIRSLDNEKSRIPIIAMTANVMKEEVALCYKAGMDDFIGKPFETDILIKKIYKLIRKQTKI